LDRIDFSPAPVDKHSANVCTIGDEFQDEIREVGLPKEFGRLEWLVVLVLSTHTLPRCARYLCTLRVELGQANELASSGFRAYLLPNAQDLFSFTNCKLGLLHWMVVATFVSQSPLAVDDE